MKKTIITLFSTVIIFGFLSTGSLKAQENVVAINILSPIVSTINVKYERKLNAESSMQLGFYYTGASWSDTKFRGFGITPEYRFYLSATEAPNGVYVAPFLRYQNLTVESDESDDFDTSKGTLNNFGGGVVMGRQWVWKERITLDIFIGPSYVAGSVDVEEGDEDDLATGAFNGFGIRTGITFGIAF
jgi:hypothetical protein